MDLETALQQFLTEEGRRLAVYWAVNYGLTTNAAYINKCIDYEEKKGNLITAWQRAVSSQLEERASELAGKLLNWREENKQYSLGAIVAGLLGDTARADGFYSCAEQIPFDEQLLQIQQHGKALQEKEFHERFPLFEQGQIAEKAGDFDVALRCYERGFWLSDGCSLAKKFGKKELAEAYVFFVDGLAGKRTVLRTLILPRYMPKMH